MTAVVVDASAGIEMVARTATGQRLAGLIPDGSELWVPDGLFDVEVHPVLRRWELRSELSPEEVAASLLRLGSWRLRRASVRDLADEAWRLRHNVTFSDA